MNIIKNILDELIRLVENNGIKYSYNTYEDSCTISFGKKRINITNFYNMEQKFFYYQIIISNGLRDFRDYNIVIESKNVDMFNKTKQLFELMKTKNFESDPNLQLILSELKTGVFEEDNSENKSLKINDETLENELPF